jgi:hypothetical protein
VGSMEATAIDDHHHLFAGFAKDAHDLRDILAAFLRVEMGHDFIEDARRSVLDGPNDAEQDPTGQAAPGAIAPPALAFERFCPFDLTVAQWAGGQTSALGAAPPAQPGQSKAPQDRFVCVQENDLALASPVLQGGELERGIGEVSGVGIEPSGGTTGA